MSLFKRVITRILPLTLAVGACLEPDDAVDEDLGVGDEPLIGQISLDGFAAAAANLALAGVPNPTSEIVIDAGTCDYDPVEPSWTDGFGGSGARYWDPLRNIYRVSSSPRLGMVPTSAAVIKLRFRMNDLPAPVTGRLYPRKLTYNADGTVDHNVYDLNGNLVPTPSASTVGDPIRMSLPPVVGGLAVDGMPRDASGNIVGPWAELNPKTISATAGTTAVTVAMRVGNYASWSIPCGSITMRGMVRIDRPPAVGTIKVAALPIGIIYEPSWPAAPGGYAKGFQRRASAIGSLVTTTLRNEGSGQDFSVESSSLAKASKVLSVLGTVVAKAPFAGASTAGAALSGLGSQLGTDSTSVFYGSVDGASATIESVYSESEDRVTNDMPTLAPTGEIGLGKRDTLCWLTDASVGYVWVDGYLRLVPIAAGSSQCRFATNLRAQIDLLRRRQSCALYPIFQRPSWCTRQAGEIPGTLADLEQVLAIDPFASIPGFTVEQAPTRFVGCMAHGEDPVYTYTWQHDTAASFAAYEQVWRSRTVTQSPGLLAIIGVGPTESMNVTLRTAHSRLGVRSGRASIGTGFTISGNGAPVSFRRCFDLAYTSAVAVPP